ncbi:MAG: glycosyltransferase family 39 protein, partial [Chloroflexota bacterium]
MQFDTPRDFTETPAESDSRAQPIRISLEAVAYLAILVFALVLRLAELDTTPLMPGETHNALAAWRVIMPNAPGEQLIATSPLLFALQSLSFSLFGASEFTARLATVIAGVALVLSPLLFRSLLGSGRAFLLSVLLAFSPVLLTASRASSPDVWALLLAALSLWGFWQAERSSRYALLAVISFAALAFLVGTGGLLLALILLIAGALTAVWRRTALLSDEDEISTGAWAALRTSLRLALPVAALVVLVVSTGFMLYPAGLSAVGEVLGGAVRALLQPTGTGGYAALVSVFYEPGLWLFAI